MSRLGVPRGIRAGGPRLRAWWPEQARVPRAMRAAMGETELDAAVAAFVADVDTEAIHGAPMVPGHGRWYPRSYRSTYAP